MGSVGIDSLALLLGLLAMAGAPSGSPGTTPQPAPGQEAAEVSSWQPYEDEE